MLCWLLQVMIKQSVRREAESRSHYELLVQVLPPHIIQRLAAGQAYIPEQHEQVRNSSEPSAVAAANNWHMMHDVPAFMHYDAAYR
jgi:hypothetical protein